LSYVFACSCTVDADNRREAEEYVIILELLLTAFYGSIKSIVSLLPGRTESNEKDSLVVLLLRLYCVGYSLLIEVVI
jgi:hypothetical protein